MHTQWAHAANFRPAKRTNLSQQIADRLRRRIVTGDLRQGSRLPALRKLARFHDVSVPTMVAAVQILVALGFLRIRPGIGTFVSSPKDNAALLTYVWRVATPYELAVLRATVDEHAAPMLAEQVRDEPWVRRPRTLGDINFLVHERSVRRIGFPEVFLKADLDFHECVVRSLPRVELGGALYRQIGTALMPVLMGVADVMAGDDELDRLHLATAAAILDGRVTDAVRAARTCARRELRWLTPALTGDGADDGALR